MNRVTVQLMKMKIIKAAMMSCLQYMFLFIRESRLL